MTRRGKEFLCRAVTRALGAFAVPVDDLPAYTPYRKGTVKAPNGAVEEMLLVSLSGCTRQARPAGAHRTHGKQTRLVFRTFLRSSWRASYSRATAG